MKTFILACLAIIALAGCGSKSLQQASTNTQVQKGTAAAQAIVQGCVSHANFITHSGRKAFVNCLAPSDPAAKARFQKCATQALAQNGVLTKSARKGLYAALTVCVEKDR